MANLWKRFIYLTVVMSLPTALLTVTFSHRPAYAGEFDTCVEKLQTVGISGEKAGTACADALIPKDLSKCVTMMHEKSNVPAEYALNSCYQVRRPIDLAYCVGDINNEITKNYSKSNESTVGNETLMLAVDTCRSSLLPARHSQCVIGLTREIQELSPDKAMETCLSAEDFPRDLFPSYLEDE